MLWSPLTSEDCRLHSSANLGKRVSETYICTGRIPLSLNLLCSEILAFFEYPIFNCQ